MNSKSKPVYFVGLFSRYFLTVRAMELEMSVMRWDSSGSSGSLTRGTV